MPPHRHGYRDINTALFIVVVFFVLLQPVEGYDRYKTTPTTHNGRKWRIGYYEGGPYVNYPANLKAIATGLVQLGWMEAPPESKMKDATDAHGVWVALTQTKSNYLMFDPQAFQTADWDDKQRKRNRKEAIARLQRQGLDMIIAMGTWAGQDLANNAHSVPVMVVSSSDPVKSGIIKSAYNSGFSHVHAKCDPNRYIRQLRLFHSIVGFKNLGVVYENSVAGKSYAAIEDIEFIAARRKFRVVKCEAPWSGVSKQECTRNLIECHKKLAPRIDALFLTVHNGVDEKYMDEILAPMVKHRIPTWSQRGPQEVRNGALLSISRGSFNPVGLYHATTMAKIFNGAKPGNLNQIFEDPRNIVINVKAARAIAFEPPKGLMMVADKIYE